MGITFPMRCLFTPYIFFLPAFQVGPGDIVSFLQTTWSCSASYCLHFILNDVAFIAYSCVVAYPFPLYSRLPVYALVTWRSRSVCRCVLIFVAVCEVLPQLYRDNRHHRPVVLQSWRLERHFHSISYYTSSTYWLVETMRISSLFKSYRKPANPWYRYVANTSSRLSISAANRASSASAVCYRRIQTSSAT